MTEVRDDRSTAGSLVRFVPPVIVALLLGAFAASNSQSTEVDFIIREAKAPLILVLVATAAVGGLVVALIQLRSHRS